MTYVRFTEAPRSGLPFIKPSSLRLFLASTTSLSALTLPGLAHAAPAGGTVVQGSAGISQAGSVTTINQASDKAIINWQSFSVGKSETVTFNQPATTSVTLNRVIGNEQSIISGALNANGRVFLVNSNGILFSQGSQVNVGGLVASTLDISDANFMAGKYTFEGTSSASVINRGRIRTGNGGYVALLGKTVSNDGVISATLGTVAMASGNKITLNFDGNSLIDVTIDEGTLNALVENKRAIKADGGRVILTAKAADQILSAQVNNTGIIQARSMSALKGGGSNNVRVGTIKLAASGGSVTSTGKLVASAKKHDNGGNVSLAATGGSVTVAGDVDVSSLKGAGGTVTVTGHDVTLTSTAAINADGASGGIILVGGDRHGGSDKTENLIAETLANAETTTIAAGATLSANGTNGKGGNIVVWSNDYTGYAGSITAAGSGSGNGGFAEVSSEGWLSFTGTADLRSANGAAGTLLLDPYNVVISNATDSGSASLTVASPTATSVINVSTLIAALANANVTITTGASGSAGSDAGNITIANALSWSTPYTLTLTAANDININAAVSWGARGGLTATAVAGNVNVNAPIIWSSGTLSLTAGKNVYVNDVLTATGSASFAAIYGTGQNSDTSPNGLYMMSASDGTYVGQINWNSTGNVTLEGQLATVIRTEGDLRDATSNLSGTYVLGGNLTGLNYADLHPFGFSSTNVFSGNFNGFGHTLTLTPQNGIDVSTAVTIPGSVKNTTFAMNSSGDISFQGLGFAENIIRLTAATNISISNLAQGSDSLNRLMLNAGNDINVTSIGSININAPLFAKTLELTAANEIDIDATVSWGTDGGLTATATGGNVNVNVPISWSSGTLALNAGRNVYVNDVLTATGSGSFSETNGTGTNAGGLPYGFYTTIGSTGYKGRLDISGTGNVTLNSVDYDIINTAAQLMTAEASPARNYVLGADIGNLSYADLAAFGFGSSSIFTGNFVGLGHSLSISPATTPLTIASAVSIPSNITLTNFNLTSSSDLNVNAPVTWSAGLLTLNAADNIYINAVMSATNNASFAATYGTGTNSDHTPMGLYTAMGTQGTFAGKINVSGTGSVTLQGAQYTVINSYSDFNTYVTPTGNYVLGSDIDGSHVNEIGYGSAFIGNFNGFGHLIENLAASGHAGGLFYQIGSTSTISNLGITNATLVVNEDANGANIGILTNINSGSIVNSFAEGTATGFSQASDYNGADPVVGGLVGLNSGLIANSYAVTSFALIGGVVNRTVEGGLVGSNAASGEIHGSYAIDAMNSTAKTGGFVGINNGLIDTSYSSGTITIVNHTRSGYFSSTIGGFVYLNSGQVENSYSITSVTRSTNASTSNSSGPGFITTGLGASYMPLIAGFAYENDGMITNTYSAGTFVTATYGSLAGFVYTNTGTISGVYSASILPSTASAFSNNNSGTILNSYWDSSFANGASETASAAVGLNSASAKSFSSYAGFDSTYWGSSADGHPILKMMPVTVLPVTGSDFVYGTLLADHLDDLTVVGLQWGDTPSEAFSVSSSATSALGLLNVGAYSVRGLLDSSSYSNITGSITVSPKVLTLATTGIVADRVYDANLDATISLSAANSGLVGLVGNETLVVTYSNASFEDKNAGTGKIADVAVTLADGTNGGLASNYVIKNATTTATIAPAILTVSYTAADKVYDGTAAATVTETKSSTGDSSLKGVMSFTDSAGKAVVDDVSLSTTGTFGIISNGRFVSDPNAGTGKIVIANLAGDDAGNYTLQVSSAVTANILPRPIELSGSKLSDGSTTVSANTLQITNVVAGETVILGGLATLASSAGGLQSISGSSGLNVSNPNYTVRGATGSVAVYTPDKVLPTGFSVEPNTGAATQSVSGTTLTVTQSTPRVVIDWTNFNIAPGYTVTFIQPNSMAIALNRVIGNEQSLISGALNANGRVFIVNSAGILFGSGAMVNVGGLVASTQDIANSDFLTGSYTFGGNAATGSIDVIGNITINQEGSYAAFLGNGVSTRGSIVAPGGTILLAGGENVSLTLGSGLSSFTIGTADKAVSAGGILNVSSTSGNGGTIETQGSSVATTDSLVASATGLTNGYWLIRQNGDLTVGAAGTITGSNLSYLLNQIDTTIQAKATSSGPGNINVNDAVSLSKNTLSMDTASSIYVNNVVTASGTGNLTVTYGTGTNADGSTMGIYTKFGAASGTFAGKINLSSSNSVTINGQRYTVISTLADLINALDSGNGLYVLGQDVTAYQAYTAAPATTFAGTLDGFGHYLNNLTIIETSGSSGYGANPAALIGTLGIGGSIKNFGVVNANVSNLYAGGALLVATNYGTLANDMVTGNLIGSGLVGGLVAGNGSYGPISGNTANGWQATPGLIENSYADVNVIDGYLLQNGYVSIGNTGGGLVSSNAYGSTILNSHSIGAITGYTAGNLGGLVGDNEGTINNSWANVTVTDSSMYPASLVGNVGGLVGLNGGGANTVGLIENNSYSLGTVYATNASSVGGIVGTNSGIIMGTVNGTKTGAVSWVYETGDIYVTITPNFSGIFSNFSAGIGAAPGRIDSTGMAVASIQEYFYANGNLHIDNLSSTATVRNVGGLVGGCQACEVDHANFGGTITTSGTVLSISQTVFGDGHIGSDVTANPIPTNTGSGTGTNTGTGTDTGTNSNTGSSAGTNTRTGTDTGTNSNTGSGAGTNTRTSTDTGSGTGANTGTGSSTGANTATGVTQRIQAAFSAAGATVTTGVMAAADRSGTSTAAKNQSSQPSNDIDIDSQLTPPTVVPSAEKRHRRKTAAVTSPKAKPAGYGASIRSIVIDGQRFDLDDAKKGGEPSSSSAPADAPAPSTQ